MYSNPKYLLAALLLALLVAGCPGSRTAELAVDPMAGITRYDYSGIRIAQQYNDRGYVHLRIYLAGGPALADPERAGLEQLAVAGALGAGAGDMDGAGFAARLEATGAQWGHYSGPEYSVVALDGLRGQMQQSWAVFSQALLHPRFGEAEFKEIRASQAALLRAEADKAGLSVMVASEKAALGRSSVEAKGRADLLESWSAAAAKDYFVNELMQKCRLVVVSSGPLDGEDLADMLFDNLDLLPSGDCPPASATAKLPAAAPLQAMAAEEGQEGNSIQYLAGVFLREDNSAERIALRHTLAWLLQRKLGERLSESGFECPAEVRVLPRAGYPLGLSLSGRRGLACTELALSELRRLRTEGLTETEWRALRREALTRSLLRRESAEGAVAQMADCILGNHWEDCGLEVNLLQRLNAKSLNSLVQKELSGLTLAYQGDTTRLDRKVLANF